MTISYRISNLILVLFAIAGMATACVKESEGECGIKLHFMYDYNMQGADGFSGEADKISVFVFDTQGNLVTSIEDTRADNNNTVTLPDITAGQYKIVAWAKSEKIDSPDADFEMTIPAKGELVNVMRAKLKTDDNGISSHALNSLLNGVVDTEITAQRKTIEIKMVKCTNDLRVVLMPIRASQVLKKDKYEIKVTANNGCLAYDASMADSTPLEYHTYFYAESSSPTKAGEPITNALIGDLALSRLFEGNDSRLIITNKETGHEILSVKLEWMLTLQAISEHMNDWSDQEYLDRQDEYSITFFIDDSTWMENRIIVNGWVLSLDDADL